MKKMCAIVVLFWYNGYAIAMDQKKLVGKIQNYSTASTDYYSLLKAVGQSDNGAFKKNICSLLQIPPTIKNITCDELRGTDNKQLASQIKLHEDHLKFLRKYAEEHEKQVANEISEQEKNSLKERGKNCMLGSCELALGWFVFKSGFRELLRPFVEYPNPKSVYFKNMFPLFFGSKNRWVTLDQEISRGLILFGASMAGYYAFKSGLLNLNKAIFFKQWCDQEKSKATAIKVALDEIHRYPAKKEVKDAKERKKEDSK